MGFGGKAGMEAANTVVDRAPVVVGVPLYGPCEVAPVTWLLFTGGAGTAGATLEAAALT